MWNVKMKSKKQYNCFQNVIYTMASFYEKTHVMMLMELWGFKYHLNRGNILGDRISLPWMGQYERRNYLLSEYHGFGFREQSSGTESSIDIVDSLDESPVGIYIDSYYCDWTSYYQVQHREHIVLCLGEKEELFFCIDDTYQDGHMFTISKEFVNKHCKHYLTFYLLEQVVQKHNFADELKTLVTQVENQQMFAQYESFRMDMMHKLNLMNEMEKESNNPVTARLFMIMKNIADDRYNFVEALEYIESNVGFNFTKSKNNLLDISKRYEKLRSYLIRCCFTGKKQDSNIIEKELLAIISMEKEIYEEIRSNIN